MKRSTINLIIYTVLGIIASLIFFNLAQQQIDFLPHSIHSKIIIGAYILPFIGLIRWILFRKIDN